PDYWLGIRVNHYIRCRSRTFSTRTNTSEKIKKGDQADTRISTELGKRVKITKSLERRGKMTKKVTIRGTDLVVHPIGLGTNAVGGQKYYPQITDNDGRAFLKTALEHGVDFWDTAFTYGPKRSEEIIGEVLAETGKRNEIVLASKAAHKF